MKESRCGVLLMTHGRQGECLLETASHMLGEWPDDVIAIGLFGTERRVEMERRCEEAIANLRRETSGVLLLSDLFGSTQATIANKIAAGADDIACAHGVNLAMLLEAIGLRQLPLAELQKRVVAAGRKSVIRGGAE